MNADRVNRWLTLGANIGVVIGLVLVAYQINQEADLIRVQLFSDATDSRCEFKQAVMGNEPMKVAAKSIGGALGDWGFQALVRTDEHCILFDAGR